MSFGETKVYFDGSHYIAIPHTTRPVRRRLLQPDEIITVVQEKEIENSPPTCLDDGLSLSIENNNSNLETNEKTEKLLKNSEKNTKNDEKTEKIKQKMTKKEFFNNLYQEFIDLPKSQKRLKIIEKMMPYFIDRELCEIYVDNNLERKKRNLLCRRIRMCRKANLANFNYFCTFTYDDKKHNEQSFKKKLSTCLKNLCYRYGWRYMGVWERAPKTNRLHFHGLFNIPNFKIIGELIEVRDYDTISHKMQTSFQSTYFNERFGRSDFKTIVDYDKDLGTELAYLMKYIEKTGEKIVYSKGLPQYFVSDIMDEDVVTRIGQEDKKLLLFDNFKCWDEGVFMGEVSPQVIDLMRKCNN